MLPSELLQAISAPGGSKVSLILGAGCSLEAPTSLPLAWEVSTKAHQRLLADNVLTQGECSHPDDLSCLADAVFKKTSSQAELVSRLLDSHEFKKPAPNEGYVLAAALLFEGAIGAVVTLNFDLALTVALGHLGVDNSVAVIDGPHELNRQTSRNVYYLHRNANAANPDDWVLRSAVIRDQWKNQWEQHVAVRALTAPAVVFAGLGSPADVLLESTKLIKAATKTQIFQVDPSDPSKSVFFQALGIPLKAFIKLKWCEFMEALSLRVVEQQLVELDSAIGTKTKDDKLYVENNGAVLSTLKSMGLVGLGGFRASLLLAGKPYSPDTPDRRALVADLLQAIPMIERTTGATARLHKHGVVEFFRTGKASRYFLLVSGRGVRGRPAIEVAVKSRAASIRSDFPALEGAIVAGTSGWTAAISPPPSILGTGAPHSIVAPPPLELVHLDNLRADPNALAKVTP